MGMFGTEFQYALIYENLTKRRELKNEHNRENKARVLWFTGLSGAGKTTIAKAVEKDLKGRGVNVAWLDGDVMREYFPCTGFSKEERNAHVLKAGFVAKMLSDHGVTVVASFISPYEETRAQVREMCARFVEIYVSTPLKECEKRDVKGLYAKVRMGEIKQFTGVDDPYEIPENPELEINTMGLGIDESAARVTGWLDENGGV